MAQSITWSVLGQQSYSAFHAIHCFRNDMMTSSNGNIFRVTCHLCEEFTGHRWIPAQRSVTRRFDCFFDLRLNKRLSKQWWGWWFETPSRSLWRHCNETFRYGLYCLNQRVMSLALTTRPQKSLWTVLPAADSTFTVRLFQQVAVRKPLYINQPIHFGLNGISSIFNGRNW